MTHPLVIMSFVFENVQNREKLVCKLCIAKVIIPNWFPTEKFVSYPCTSRIPDLEFHKTMEISLKSVFGPLSTVAIGGDKYANQT